MFNESQLNIIKELKRNISNKNFSRIRAILDNNIMWHSADLDYLNKCVSLCKELPGVFEIHDSNEYSLDVDNWTEEYLLDLQGEQFSNYSLERYVRIVEVTNYLYKQNTNAIDETNTNKASQNFNNVRCVKNSNKACPKKIVNSKRESQDFQIQVVRSKSLADNVLDSIVDGVKKVKESFTNYMNPKN